MDGVLVFSPELHSHLASSFAYVHSACITTEPYTIATFLPPLDETRLAKWWSARFKEAADGHRKIIMQMAPNPNTGKPELAGCVMLHMPETETGPFRGTVEKLLVSPEHRQKGIAKRMMEKLEEVAREEKRTLLMLDTITGSPAEAIYPKFGYIEVGQISEYGISPFDGSLKGATFFYKRLLSDTKVA